MQPPHEKGFTLLHANLIQQLKEEMAQRQAAAEEEAAEGA